MKGGREPKLQAHVSVLFSKIESIFQLEEQGKSPASSPPLGSVYLKLLKQLCSCSEYAAAIKTRVFISLASHCMNCIESRRNAVDASEAILSLISGYPYDHDSVSVAGGKQVSYFDDFLKFFASYFSGDRREAWRGTSTIWERKAGW